MSEALVWLDGQILPEKDALVSAASPGLLVGMGVFETMAVYAGGVFAFGRHYRRLEEGCARIAFKAPAAELLETAMGDLLQANGLTAGRGRARITLFEGTMGIQTLVQVSPVQKREGYAQLVVSPYRRNELGGLAGVKATAYAENILALRVAAKIGADEVVILNSRGEVCEGATSNLFCIEEEKVVTPPLSSGCLPGVTREIVIELCQRMGIQVSEEPLLLERLLMSDGVFLTGSLREVQAVQNIGDVTWQNPDRGLVEKISQAFQTYVKEST